MFAQYCCSIVANIGKWRLALLAMNRCRYWHYPTVLPTASIIIVFHNEGFSSLMRTVHSVISMSPPQLLHEVVMVDDFSDKGMWWSVFANYYENMTADTLWSYCSSVACMCLSTYFSFLFCKLVKLISVLSCISNISFSGSGCLVRIVQTIFITRIHGNCLEILLYCYWLTENLKSELEEYVKQFNGKVKLYRNTKRLGLIGTRTNGARYSKGDVIVFLDAHCECQPNWLPPLLTRIAYDR